MTTISEDLFGAADLSNSGATTGPKFKRWKLAWADKGSDEFSVTLRVLGPMLSYRTGKKWAFYCAQHWGYEGNNKYKPGQTRKRPFACIQEKDFNTKEITVHCPQCDRNATLKQNLNLKRAELESSGASRDKIREILEPMVAEQKRYSTDRKMYLNCMSPEGEFGTLAIPLGVFNDCLKPAINKLSSEKGINALDPAKGVWFKFIRRGTNVTNMTDSVEVVMETTLVNGEAFERIKTAPLSLEQQKAAVATCPDIGKEGALSPILSLEQISLLLNCSGDPDEVDRIWSLGTSEGQLPEAEAPRPAPAPAPAPRVVDLMAKEADEGLRAVESPPVQAPVQQSPVGTTGNSPISMSKEEFYARFGKKG